MKTLIVNRGTCRICNETLISKHRHDYIRCSCGKSGLDGGLEYIRSMGNIQLSPLYLETDYEIIRKTITRTNKGINLNKSPKAVKLCNMSNDWLIAVLEYTQNNKERAYTYAFLGLHYSKSSFLWINLCEKELEYRKANNIYRKNNKYEK